MTSATADTVAPAGSATSIEGSYRTISVRPLRFAAYRAASACA
jgi:hypothetical protein